MRRILSLSFIVCFLHSVGLCAQEKAFAQETLEALKRLVGHDHQAADNGREFYDRAAKEFRRVEAIQKAVSIQTNNYQNFDQTDAIGEPLDDDVDGTTVVDNAAADKAKLEAFKNAAEEARKAKEAIGTLPQTLGLEDWLKKRSVHFRIPEFDQQPESTAAELADLYRELAADTRRLKQPFALLIDENGIPTPSGTNILKKQKDRLNKIFDDRPGRRQDWSVLFIDLQGKLQELSNEDQFFNDGRSWQLAFEELAKGFEELSNMYGVSADLTPEERRAMVTAGRGASGDSAGQSEGNSYRGISVHEFLMSHIHARHNRRIARRFGR